MKIFYYYYYLFYRNVYKESEPVLGARLAFTASEVLIFVSFIRICSAFFFCYVLSKYYMFALALILLLLNTYIFLPRKRVEVILKSRPLFFQSRALTIFLTWIFFLISLSSMYWLGYAVQGLINNCQK